MIRVLNSFSFKQNNLKGEVFQNGTENGGGIDPTKDMKWPHLSEIMKLEFNDKEKHISYDKS